MPVEKASSRLDARRTENIVWGEVHGSLMAHFLLCDIVVLLMNSCVGG